MKKIELVAHHLEEENIKKAQGIENEISKEDADENSILEYLKKKKGLQQEEVMNIFEKLTKIGTEKSIDYVCDLISLDGDVFFEYNLLPILKTNIEYSFGKLSSLIEEKDPKKQSLNEWHFSELILTLSNLLGVENFRDRLVDIINDKKKKGEDASSHEYAFSHITPCSDKTAITNLQSFYEENIKFEEYEVNQKMNEKEVALLQDLIGKDEKVFEMGCGTGRLLLEMAQSGYDMTGIDFTPRHVELIRQNNPDAKVFQADWHDTKFQGGEFDTVYSLGRNVLHDYSIVDQAATFRESGRLLKKGGKFILDIPNREKGAYGEMVKGYAEEMKKRGIKNFRYGTIYDSPDGEHFATRYAYSHEDVELLCQIAGFEIKEVRREKLETGSDDENLYYILEKK